MTTGYKPKDKFPIGMRNIKKINEQIAHLGKDRTHDPKKLIKAKARRRIVGSLARELVRLHKYWRPRWVASWRVVPSASGYEIRRPGKRAIVLRLK